MKDITIAFSDYGGILTPKFNFILKALEVKYNIDIVDISKPHDFLFYSTYGYDHLKSDAIKIYFTAENDVPDFNFCDYAISFNNIDFRNRHLTLPYYVMTEGFDRLRRNLLTEIKNPFERDFCSFVVSNKMVSAPIRKDFFIQLSKYQRIASGGGYMNNIGKKIEDKNQFLQQYKFNIAFENSSYIGYTTEKIFDAFLNNTIPIYWGNPDIHKEINPSSFVLITGYNDMEQGIKQIKELQNNKDKYLKMLYAKPIDNNPFLNWEEDLLSFFDNIYISNKKYIAKDGRIRVMHNLKYQEKLITKFTLIRKFLTFYNIKRGCFNH